MFMTAAAREESLVVRTQGIRSLQENSEVSTGKRALMQTHHTQCERKDWITPNSCTQAYRDEQKTDLRKEVLR